MRQTWVATVVVATMGMTFLLHAESPKSKRAASTDAAASKKEVVHIVIGSGSDLKQGLHVFPVSHSALAHIASQESMAHGGVPIDSRSAR